MSRGACVEGVKAGRSQAVSWEDPPGHRRDPALRVWTDLLSRHYWSMYRLTILNTCEHPTPPNHHHPRTQDSGPELLECQCSPLAGGGARQISGNFSRHQAQAPYVCFNYRHSTDKETEAQRDEPARADCLVHVQCMRQGAQGWCTGTTQRDGMGREVGGGFRMGDSCIPMADAC